MKIELSQAIKTIEEEPEYPGELPKDLKNIIQRAIEEKDEDLIVRMLRITVQLTKKGIKERIQKLDWMY